MTERRRSALLKKFLEEQVGPRFNCSNPTNADGLQYCVFNNLFNGGMARFYDGDTGSTGSVKKADIEYNSNMDLIDTGKYDKN